MVDSKALEEDKTEVQLVPIKLPVKDCPPFLLELKRMAEESKREYPNEVGHDIICLGSINREENAFSAVERFADCISLCNVQFQLTFGDGATCKVVFV